MHLKGKQGGGDGEGKIRLGTVIHNACDIVLDSQVFRVMDDGKGAFQGKLTIALL